MEYELLGLSLEDAATRFPVSCSLPSEDILSEEGSESEGHKDRVMRQLSSFDRNFKGVDKACTSTSEAETPERNIPACHVPRQVAPYSPLELGQHTPLTLAQATGACEGEEGAEGVHF
jgi:hypothetical protein